MHQKRFMFQSIVAQRCPRIYCICLTKWSVWKVGVSLFHKFGLDVQEVKIFFLREDFSLSSHWVFPGPRSITVNHGQIGQSMLILAAGRILNWPNGHGILKSRNLALRIWLQGCTALPLPKHAISRTSAKVQYASICMMHAMHGANRENNVFKPGVCHKKLQEPMHTASNSHQFSMFNTSLHDLSITLS